MAGKRAISRFFQACQTLSPDFARLRIMLRRVRLRRAQARRRSAGGSMPAPGPKGESQNRSTGHCNDLWAMCEHMIVWQDFGHE